MRTRPLLGLKLLAISALLLQSAAHAELITSAASLPAASTVITFDEFGGVSTAGPVNLAHVGDDDIIFTSSPFAELGARNRSLGGNGTWGDGAVFVASDFIATSGELGFSFSTAVSSVGAFFNQYQSPTATGPNFLTLLAYDVDGNTLETYRYFLDTAPSGVNEGQFLGIQRESQDIYGFGIADGNFVLDNLTYSVTPVSPVPEPSAWVLLMAGLGCMAWVRRKQLR